MLSSGQFCALRALFTGVTIFCGLFTQLSLLPSSQQQPISVRDFSSLSQSCHSCSKNFVLDVPLKALTVACGAVTRTVFVDNIQHYLLHTRGRCRRFPRHVTSRHPPCLLLSFSPLNVYFRLIVPSQIHLSFRKGLCPPSSMGHPPLRKHAIPPRTRGRWKVRDQGDFVVHSITSIRGASFDHEWLCQTSSTYCMIHRTNNVCSSYTIYFHPSQNFCMRVVVVPPLFMPSSTFRMFWG